VLIEGGERERIIELKEEKVVGVYVNLIRYNRCYDSLVEMVRSDEMIHSMK
jgi:hypothetical protein